MQRRWLAVSAAAMLVLGTAISAQAASSVAERNKETVIAFYNALMRGDVATLKKLGRPDYRQHNPAYETGLVGLIKHIESRPPRPAGAKPLPPLKFVRVIADDHYVMTLRRMSPPPGIQHPPGAVRANVDIFRVQNGKVAEHWDYQETFPRAGAPVPPKNDNGPF